jgi:hypothetical protein
MPETTSDIAELTEALHLLQQNLPSVAKGNTADTGKYKYNYADLNDVQDAIFPLLAEYGLTWTTAPTLTHSGFALRYALRHSSGQAIEGDYYLPSGTPQEIGSAITYARRYALCAVTGLAPGGDDDDGVTASRPAPAVSDATEKQVEEWVLALTDAGSLSELQDVWERAGRAGVTGDSRVIATKDRQKGALK